MLRIISANLNGIRSASKKGFFEWMGKQEADMVCVQELKAQETRLTTLMKAVEPLLDDALHAKVTELLCELTAYDLMQTLHEMQKTRHKTVFRG